MAVSLDFELRVPSPDTLQRAPERVQRAHAGIPGPREHELAGAPRADHLIVDQIRGEARQREVAPSLADDLVPRREADEVSEPLDDDRVAVVDEARAGVAHGQHLGGVVPQPLSAIRRTRVACLLLTT